MTKIARRIGLASSNQPPAEVARFMSALKTAPDIALAHNQRGVMGVAALRKGDLMTRNIIVVREFIVISIIFTSFAPAFTMHSGYSASD